MATGASGAGSGSVTAGAAALTSASKLGPLAVLVTIEDDAERKAARLARGDIARALGMGEDDLGAAHFKGMVDLWRRLAVVERRQDQSRLEAGEVMDEERGAVGHQRCHAIVGFKPSAK